MSALLPLNPQQRAWLLLSGLPGVGPRTLARLLAEIGNGEAILQAPLPLLARLGVRAAALKSLEHWRHAPHSHPSYSQCQQLQRWLQCPEHGLLSFDCDGYPRSLKQIADPPSLLYLRGDPDVLRQAQIALVGSRHASTPGLKTAYAFARQLSLSGWIPISGLALGIDQQAHLGALDGFGLTVAVLGTGVDVIYPRRHCGLAERILAAGGALVSEYPLGTPPRARHFPRRNRIISGLSMATLVVEASLNSGSLITASQALEQGREVFAIPGSIHSPTSKGCHQLIRQGAKLVECVDHIYEELAPQLPGMGWQGEKDERAASLQGQLPLGPIPEAAPAAAATPALSALEQQLMNAIGYQTLAVDELVEHSALKTDQVIATLLELELRGLIQSVVGGYQRR